MKPLGTVLLEMGAIDELQLKAALSHQQQWGVHLGQALVDLKFCSRADVLRGLSLQTGHPLIDLDTQELDPALTAALPEKAAYRYRVVPLRFEGKRMETLVVAIAAPAPLDILDTVRTSSGKTKVSAFLANDDAVARALDELYKGTKRNAPRAAIELDPALLRDETALELEGASQPPQVWLHGWNGARQRALEELLRQAGVSALALPDDELSGARPEDVVLSSTLALQMTIPSGQTVRSRKVLVCGLAGDEDCEQARQLGVRMYLRPPFTPERFRAALEKLAPDALGHR